jgi:RhtB (resistance to homoserine/threonine) family protein
VEGIVSGIDNYLVFVLSGVLLNLTPGNDTIYILTRSIAQGRKAGVLSVLGISSGGLTHTVLASLGLSVVLSKSIFLFNSIKFVGAGYLIYLGVRAFLSKPELCEDPLPGEKGIDYRKIYAQGYLTNLFNPKVALFFLSFLPQFINPNASNSPVPFLILGCTFLTTGTIWCMFLALAASALCDVLRKSPKISAIMQKLCGAVFVGLGLRMAMEKR